MSTTSWRDFAYHAGMFGLLNLHKPAGSSSREAVDYVARLIRPEKAGHAGTLDPIATGVLVVCIGPATRLIEYVQQMHKCYRARFELGCASPSDDMETEVTRLADAPRPSRDEVLQAAERFVGTFDQRPPAFSAVKVRGRRSYALARKGKLLELPPRPVTIYRLQLNEYVYPHLELSLECSSGTYVRALGRDLAAALGTSCVMTALERTAVGPFTIAQAIDPRSLTRDNLPDHLQPALDAVPHLPRITLSAEELDLVVNGRNIARRVTGSELAAIDQQGELVAILVPRGRDELGPTRNFCNP